jgi:hypothetical protein
VPRGQKFICQPDERRTSWRRFAQSGFPSSDAAACRVSGRDGAAGILGLKPTTLHAKMKSSGSLADSWTVHSSEMAFDMEVALTGWPSRRVATLESMAR